MTTTEPLTAQPGPNTSSVPQPGPAPAEAGPEVHSADQVALCCAVIGFGGICLVGLFNVMVHYLSH